MPLLSVSKASKLFDVSRPTLQRALKEGKISGIKTEKGGAETWQIEQSELARLYSLREPDAVKLSANDQAIGQQHDMPKKGDLAELPSQYVIKLERELAVALAKIEEKQQTIDVLQEALRLLPKPRPEPDQEPKREEPLHRKSLWARIFG
jgi:excisionase family DNA binding protein